VRRRHGDLRAGAVGAEDPAVAVHVRRRHVDEGHVGMAGRHQIDVLPREGTGNHLPPVDEFHVGAAVIPGRHEGDAHRRRLEAGRHAVVRIIVKLDHPLRRQVPQQRGDADDLVAPPGELDAFDRHPVRIEDHRPGQQLRANGVGLEGQGEIPGAVPNNLVHRRHGDAGVDEAADADVDPVLDVFGHGLLEARALVVHALGFCRHDPAGLIGGRAPPLEGGFRKLLVVLETGNLLDLGTDCFFHELTSTYSHIVFQSVKALI